MVINLNKERDRKGLVATILIHTIIFLLLLIWVMAEDEEMIDTSQGVQVSFGDFEAGGSDEINMSSEESASPSTPSPTPSTSPSTPSPSSPVSSPDPVETSDSEDAPEMSESSKTTEQTQEKTEDNQGSVDPRLAEILKKMGQNKKTGDENKSSGPGIKDGPKGSKEDDGPGLAGKSTGSRGDIDWSLTGFTISHFPNIQNKSQDHGSVKVEVCLSRSGEIKSTRWAGGTASSAYLTKISIEAVKNMRFEPAGDERKEVNCGTITINYGLR